VYKPGEAEPIYRTLFHWQGLRLLQEVQSGLPSLYVYTSPNSYEPGFLLLPGHDERFFIHAIRL
jgi:hypothetical protein